MEGKGPRMFFDRHNVDILTMDVQVSTSFQSKTAHIVKTSPTSPRSRSASTCGARSTTAMLPPVPHGYRGTCVAAPGYDIYYLNVMAGPNECLVQFAPDDPAHHWIRATWVHQEEAPPPHGQVRKPRKDHPPVTKPTREPCA